MEEAKKAKEKRIEVAKKRAKLGFKDVEVLEDGTVVDAKDGDGMQDDVLE